MLSYTLKEAEKITGKSEATLRRYVKNGKLHASMQEGIYVIPEDELAKVKTKVTTQPITEIPLPTNNVQELLEAINAGFKAIADNTGKIAEEYKLTVMPLVNSVASQSDETQLNMLLAYSETVTNNIIRYQLTHGNKWDISPEDYVNLMFEGVTVIPAPFLEVMKSAIVATIKQVQNKLDMQHTLASA